MNRGCWVLALFLLVALAPARAADHRDGPGVLTDPSTDINDLFAWMSPDASRVELAISVFPGASAQSRFSDAAVYAFHLRSSRSLGDKSPIQFTIVCTFDVAQRVSCWGPEGTNEFVSGAAGAPSGLASPSGRMRVFAGRRDDPFFFNATGFRNAVSAAAAALGQDPRACPASLAGAASLLVNVMQHGAANSSPVDSFQTGGDATPGYSGDALMLVVEIDKTLITDAAFTLLGVWASTHRAQ